MSSVFIAYLDYHSLSNKRSTVYHSFTDQKVPGSIPHWSRTFFSGLTDTVVNSTFKKQWMPGVYLGGEKATRTSDAVVVWKYGVSNSSHPSYIHVD